MKKISGPLVEQAFSLQAPRFLLIPIALIASVTSCLAVETKYWQENDQAGFEKGTLKSISVRSDGRMSLAPALSELYDSAEPYLWAIARDSKGNLYTGGGGVGDTAKLFVISADGHPRTLASVPGLEIHAIAIGHDDGVYVATNPDGQVWRVGAGGKPQPYFNPHAKYIWAMAFDSHGNLYIATGDRGEIFRVTPEGKGALFFQTEETHARSLAIDHNDNVIVGTDPSGLILRVSPAGTGFVLYQAAKREITALGVASDGSIYAAGAGNKAAVTAPAPSSPVSTPPPAAAASISVATVQPGSPAPPITVQHPLYSAPSTASGGSEVYRIGPDDSPSRVWTNSQALVYAITFDQKGTPLLGTGNSGRIYRIDSDILSTILLDTPPTQITAFAAGSDGVLYAATGNIGRVYRMGPGLAAAGTYESDVLDANQFSHWGRFTIQGSPAGIAVSTRSGNMSRTQNNWSPWAAVRLQQDPGCASCEGGSVTSPPARFLQYRLAFSSAAGASPSLSETDLAYLPKNVAPRLEAIEIAQANYRFPAPSLQPANVPSPSTLSLPPLGALHRSPSAPTLEPSSSPQTLTYSKGIVGVRWAASDDNGDPLVYNIDIRSAGDQTWIPLRQGVREKYTNIESTAFPDGEYQVRVTASDAPGNPEGQALTSTIVSDPFLIDNTPPQITGLTASSGAPGIQLHWRARDARSVIDKAEYSVNGGEWQTVAPVGGLSDSLEEDYSVTVPREGSGPRIIAVRVTDDYDNSTVAETTLRF